VCSLICEEVSAKIALTRPWSWISLEEFLRLRLFRSLSLRYCDDTNTCIVNSLVENISRSLQNFGGTTLFTPYKTLGWHYYVHKYLCMGIEWFRIWGHRDDTQVSTRILGIVSSWSRSRPRSSFYCVPNSSVKNNLIHNLCIVSREHINWSNSFPPQHLYQCCRHRSECKTIIVHSQSMFGVSPLHNCLTFMFRFAVDFRGV
jgi:hypothetical protein